MKQKDMILIGLIVVVTGIASYVVSNMLFASKKSRQQEVEVVKPITSEFNKPDQKYFNASSVNPTKTITIGEGSNPEPFKNDN